MDPDAPTNDPGPVPDLGPGPIRVRPAAAGDAAFADNDPARRFYERLGFREDSLKLVKVLQD